MTASARVLRRGGARSRCPQHAGGQGRVAVLARASDRQGPPMSARAVAEEAEGVTSRTVECVGEGQAVSCTIEEGTESTSGRQTDTDPDTPQLLGALGAGALLISPFFFWGTSMVAMKIAGPHSTPLFTASVRLIPAGLAVVAYGAARGRPTPPTTQAWLAILLFGAVDGMLFQGFLAAGLEKVPAGIGSVIIDSQPLTVALVASLLFGEALSSFGVLGLALGISGLLLLEVPLSTLQGWLNLGIVAPEEAVSIGEPWWQSGQLLMLLAAQSMAAGTLMVPWVTRFADPIMATGWHMVLGGIPLVALSLLTEPGELASRLSQATSGDIAALTYTSLLGSAAAYGVFFYNASKGNLTKLSSLTFLTPMFASVAGLALLDERLTPWQLTGAAVTLAGVLLMNYKTAEANKD